MGQKRGSLARLARYPSQGMRKRGAMANLPDDVIKAKQALSRNPSDELAEIGKKLIADSPELVGMWRAYERQKHPDDPPGVWVWQFLRLAKDASSLPTFHYKSVKERHELEKTIKDLATRLARKLEANGLDAHLIHNDGKMFNGFFVYEDFGDSNRARIDARGVNKPKLSELVRGIAERARKKITEEPMPGKAGSNVEAIRFVRMVAKSNRRLYGKPLNAPTAVATNAIFGTSYRASDIPNLLSRKRLQS
jgi:hypothetical protein